MVDRGQHGHPDRSASLQPRTQQTTMDCVFWHLSIRTSDLSNSSSLDWTPWACLLPLFIREPWPPTILSEVNHCSLLGCVLRETDTADQVDPARSAVLAIILPCQTITVRPLLNTLKSVHLPFCPASNTSTLRRNVHFLPNIFHPLAGATMKGQSVLFTCQWS